MTSTSGGKEPPDIARDKPLAPEAKVELSSIVVLLELLEKIDVAELCHKYRLSNVLWKDVQNLIENKKTIYIDEETQKSYQVTIRLHNLHLKLTSEKHKRVFLYTKKDDSPFVVLVEGTDNNAGPLRDIQLGKILGKKQIRNILRLEKRGRNRVAVFFNDYKQANDFVKHEMHQEHNTNAFIPANAVSSQGVIRNIDLDITEEEFLKEVQCKQNIISARRMNFRTIEEGRVMYKPTQTIVATFEGKTIPRSINIFLTGRLVEPYILPVVQCYQCLEYGHTNSSGNCKRKNPRCPKCTTDPGLEDCDADGPLCYQCGGNHLATERGRRVNERICPEFVRQKTIKEMMSTQGLSYYEASNMCKRTHNKVGFENKNKKSTQTFRENEFPPIRTVKEKTPEPRRQTTTSKGPSYSATVAAKRTANFSPPTTKTKRRPKEIEESLESNNIYYYVNKNKHTDKNNELSDIITNIKKIQRQDPAKIKELIYVLNKMNDEFKRTGDADDSSGWSAVSD